MRYLDNVVFVGFLVVGLGFFFRGLWQIYQNINLGKDINRSDNTSERWRTMARIALGQGKMMTHPVAGFLHLLVYIGFVIINIELLEIVIDGVFGTHRFLASVVSHGFYTTFTASLEVMAILVILAVVAFFIRRNLYGVKRLNMKELNGWAKDDANWILVIEFSLMVAFFVMNSSDFVLQQRKVLASHGVFPISQILFVPILEWFSFGDSVLIFFERFAWWFHFVGILFFMNYLYHSKHLHIIFAFPNTWFAKLEPKGQLDNMASVTKEIKLMMDPNATSFATTPDAEATPERFGANDIFDLHKVQLLNAYTCTECGRCTAVCPANITGKKLSPRKIMMATRDRIEAVGKNIKLNGKFIDDGKKLLDDYISREELRACTTCNACVEACPILIDPLSIIMELRRFMIMEESSAPQEWNMMFQNIENNAAPWQYNQSDRLNWANES